MWSYKNMSNKDIKTLKIHLNMQQKPYASFIDQKVGKSDDFGPKMTVF